MPPMIGNLIVVLILAGIIGYAIHALWKKHKNGGGCCGCESGGSCGCGCGCGGDAKKKK